MMLSPPGELVQIKNYTNQIIKDLYYTYADYPERKVNKIHRDTKEKFLIITSNLNEDYDLVLYFKSKPQNKYIFPKAVKRKKGILNYSYLFLKIVENENEIQIVEDPDSEKEFYSDNS